MRELIIYTGNFSEPENNAAGKRVYGNSLILEDLGYDVFLVGKNSEQSLSVRKQYSEHIFYEPFPNYGLLKVSGYINHFKEIIRNLEQKPVCIIRYGSPSLSIFDYLLLRYAHQNGIKVIADVVDWLSADGGNIVFNIIKTIDTYFEKAVFNKQSDGIIAISSYLGNYYRRRTTSVAIIPPIVSEYHHNDADNKVINLVYAGAPFRLGVRVKNVHKIKDRLDLAIEAFAKTYLEYGDSFVFNVYGITKEQYLTAFPQHKDLLDKNTETIIFHGRKPMGEVQKKIMISDYSVLFREVTRGTTAGFPTKVVESMSCGTPLITTKTSDLPEYINSGNNGFFVDIDDISTLVKEIHTILSLSKDELKIMKNRCFEECAFLPSKYADQMDRLLKTIK